MSYRSRTLLATLVAASLSLAACDSNDPPADQRDIAPPSAERDLGNAAEATYDDLRDNTEAAWDNTKRSANEAAEDIDRRTDELAEDTEEAFSTE